MRVQSVLPVKKGALFLCAFFAFQPQQQGILYKCREAVGIPGGAGKDTNNKEVPLEMRVKVTLRCNECKQRNYNTMKNKKNTPDKLELKKYCRFCKKHTTHTETK